MTQRFDNGRPVIHRLLRYVVPFENGSRPGEACMLGDLILQRGAGAGHFVPKRWNANIIFAREAFADYCARHGL